MRERHDPIRLYRFALAAGDWELARVLRRCLAGERRAGGAAPRRAVVERRGNEPAAAQRAFFTLVERLGLR